MNLKKNQKQSNLGFLSEFDENSKADSISVNADSQNQL